MCHTLKHINSLVLLLRNYRIRLNSNRVRNRLMDTHHSAAYGAKILTKEAIAQSELLKIQLHGMLHKIDPVSPPLFPYFALKMSHFQIEYHIFIFFFFLYQNASKEISSRKGKSSSSKNSKLLCRNLFRGLGGIFFTAASISLLLSMVLSRRQARCNVMVI